jgi:glycine/D-amino acid oxidase-like deaminating enzyme
MGLSIAVVGGGIGGLFAANALFARGFDVAVYEQAPALGEVGAFLARCDGPDAPPPADPAVDTPPATPAAEREYGNRAWFNRKTKNSKP